MHRAARDNFRPTRPLAPLSLLIPAAYRGPGRRAQPPSALSTRRAIPVCAAGAIQLPPRARGLQFARRFNSSAAFEDFALFGGRYSADPIGGWNFCVASGRARCVLRREAKGEIVPSSRLDNLNDGCGSEYRARKSIVQLRSKGLAQNARVEFYDVRGSKGYSWEHCVLSIFLVNGCI